MLDPKLLRQHLNATAEHLQRRGFVLDTATLERLESERKHIDIRTQELQAERNRSAKRVGELIREGQSPEQAKSSVQSVLDTIAAELATLEEQQRQAQQALEQAWLEIPNIPAADVPEGMDEHGNREVSRWGTPRHFDFAVQDHVSLGEALDGLRFDLASRIAGSRFAVLRGATARLHRALTQFMLDLHTQEHGYEEVYVPYLVNRDSLQGTGQLPKFEADLFRLQEPDYYLIPTAEVPVTNLVRDSIINKAFPGSEAQGLHFVAHTPCFRSEAGSYGRDTRGMIRQHQFEKVELVSIVRAEQAEATLERLTGHAETVLQRLGLPYRKMLLCAGDMGFSARKTYDLEVWLPAQNTYREISSCSHFGDFQARRLKARWQQADGKTTEPAHTLNGSGLAVGRTLVAVLENYQNADGSITVPEALRPYLHGLDRLTVPA